LASDNILSQRSFLFTELRQSVRIVPPATEKSKGPPQLEVAVEAGAVALQRWVNCWSCRICCW